MKISIPSLSAVLINVRARIFALKYIHEAFLLIFETETILFTYLGDVAAMYHEHRSGCASISAFNSLQILLITKMIVIFLLKFVIAF